MASPGGFEWGNLAGFLGDYLRRGLSMRQGIEEFRDRDANGVARNPIGNEKFRSTWKSVADSLLMHPTVSSLPGDATPGAQHYSAWSTATPDRFGHQVTLHVWDQQIGGVIQRDWMVMSDFPLSPDDATQFAIDEFNDSV